MYSTHDIRLVDFNLVAVNVKGQGVVSSPALITFPSCSEEHADQFKKDDDRFQNHDDFINHAFLQIAGVRTPRLTLTLPVTVALFTLDIERSPPARAPHTAPSVCSARTSIRPHPVTLGLRAERRKTELTC